MNGRNDSVKSHRYYSLRVQGNAYGFKMGLLGREKPIFKFLPYPI